MQIWAFFYGFWLGQVHSRRAGSRRPDAIGVVNHTRILVDVHVGGARHPRRAPLHRRVDAHVVVVEVELLFEEGGEMVRIIDNNKKR